MTLTPSEKTYLFFDSFTELSYSVKKKLYALFPDFSELLKKTAAGNDSIQKIVGSELFSKIKKNCIKDYFQKILQNFVDNSLEILTVGSKDYPASLQRLKEPPFVLYCKGNKQLLNSDCISVVGSRECSKRAAERVKNLSFELSKSGLTVVSGLADGADTAAHEGALSAGGNTIAVLAGGVDHIYPASNRELYKEIEQKGLILSENPPDFKPYPASFLIRNRIIAGLSKGTLITYAKARSGTKVTAEYTLECGSELMILPGEFDSEESEGCNLMIRELQGAVVLSCEDILGRLKSPLPVSLKKFSSPKKAAEKSEKPKKQKAEKVILPKADEKTQKLLDYLEEKRHLNDLAEFTKLPVSELSVLLFDLELEDRIQKLPANFYIVLTN